MSGIAKWVAGSRAKFQHGTRNRYQAGCFCPDCCNADRVYRRAMRKRHRQGIFNTLVDAAAARDHLLKLSRRGVGRRAVADACDVNKSVLQLIKLGKRKQIRKSTEQRILAVTKDAIADHATMYAGRTWQRIRKLVDEGGFTQKEIARRLGYKKGALQFRRGRILAKNASKVERLYRSLLMAA